MSIEFECVFLDAEKVIIKLLSNRDIFLLKSNIDIFPSEHLKEVKPTGWIAKDCVRFGRVIFLHKDFDEIVHSKLTNKTNVKDYNKKSTRII